MPIALQGSPGNAAPGVPFTTRDVDGSPENFVFATGVLAFSGSYTTGGDAADFTKLDSLASQTVVNATAFSQNGSANGYVFVQNAAMSGWKLKVFAPGGTEIAAGAYPASVSSDVVAFQLTLRKLL